MNPRQLLEEFELESESDFSDFTEYTTDTNSEIYDRIYQEEEDFIDTEKEHGKYYIGICDLVGREHIIGMVISLNLFYSTNYTYEQKVGYMYAYDIYDSIMENPNTMDIMKLDILQDGTYRVIIKTFWIKIIQRSWRRLYKRRQEMIRERCAFHDYYMIHGKYPYGYNVLPTIIGMV
jgi:hypothetical protein